MSKRKFTAPQLKLLSENWEDVGIKNPFAEDECSRASHIIKIAMPPHEGTVEEIRALSLPEDLEWMLKHVNACDPCFDKYDKKNVSLDREVQFPWSDADKRSLDDVDGVKNAASHFGVDYLDVYAHPSDFDLMKYAKRAFVGEDYPHDASFIHVSACSECANKIQEYFDNLV